MRRIETETYEGEDRRSRSSEPFGLRHLGAFLSIFVTVVGGLFFTYNNLTNQIAASDATHTQQISSLNNEVQSLKTNQQSVASLALSAATLSTRVDRDEQDISGLRTGLANQTQALIEATRQLTTVNDKLEFLTTGKGGRR